MVVIGVQEDAVVGKTRATMLETYLEKVWAIKRASNLWRTKKYENLVVYDEDQQIVVWEDGEATR